MHLSSLAFPYAHHHHTKGVGSGLHVRVFPGAHMKNTNVILYSYGNTEDVQRIAPRLGLIATELLDNCIVTWDYPGCGDSDGVGYETSVHEAILQVYDWIRIQFPHATIIYIWGRSEGTGPTTYLATQRPIQGIILESGATSAIRWKLNTCYEPALIEYTLDFIDNYQRVQELGDTGKKVLFIHGEKDTLIPPWHCHELYRVCTCSNKKLVIIPERGHRT